MSSTDILDADYRTGQVKIHGAADFEGMRVAGKLAAECLDMLIPHVVPGVVTEAPGYVLFSFRILMTPCTGPLGVVFRISAIVGSIGPAAVLG